MTLWAEWLWRRAVLPAAVLLAVVLPVAVACAGTNGSVVADAPAVSGGGLPPWMEVSALATGVTEWADLEAAWLKQPDERATPVKDFTLPVEHYDNGRIRAVLHAVKGAIGQNGLIWSWQVTISMFDPNGKPDGRVDAESCLYDRNARRGYCPTGVQLVRTNATIVGTGLYWTMENQHMRILSKPVVRMQRGTSIFGGSKQ